jgi:RNA polymerase sigma-70 factor (ECF subfamily)
MDTSTYQNDTPARRADAELLARLRAGEQAAYQELVRDNAGRMLAVARRLLRCDSEAEDAVQEAFTQAYQALPRFEGHALLSTWLHRIAVNACLIRLRKRKRRGERSIEELLPRYQDDGHRLDVGEPWPADALAQLEQHEVRSAVRKAIDALPERHRCVLLLRDIEGLSSEEVAERLGIRADAVKMRLHRARQALRTLLDPQLAGRGTACADTSRAAS